MELYPLLSFDCFDRLFPNQDIMPEGGFGNLIALPLQLEPRKYSNSVFINNEGVPYNDQWSILAATQKVTKSQLQSTLNQLNFYIEIAPYDIEKNEPWNKLNGNDNIKINDCPKSLSLTLADQLYVPIANLPGKLTSTLKHCAVFSNPEFYKRQALRLSTIGTSRYICSAHIENGFLILPRGCLAEVNRIVSEQAIEIEYTDKRFSGNLPSKRLGWW